MSLLSDEAEAIHSRRGSINMKYTQRKEEKLSSID